MAPLEAAFQLVAPEPEPKKDSRLVTLVARDLHVWLDQHAETKGFPSTAAYVRSLLEAHQKAVKGGLPPTGTDNGGKSRRSRNEGAQEDAA